MVAGKTDKGITFFQEKNFNFGVKIFGPSLEQKETVSESNKNIVKKQNFTIPVTQTEKVTPNTARIIFWLVVITISLLVCWVLYKL
jgi:predicted S18 family serine protease